MPWNQGGGGAASLSQGSGADGAVNFNGTTTPVAGATLSGTTYTLTRNVQATSITIAPGITVNTGAFVMVPTTSGAASNDLNAYGNGSDGTINFDGVTTPVAGATLSGSTYTMTRDIQASSIITGGVILKPNGFRIFCTSALTIQDIVIDNSGNGQAAGTGNLLPSPSGGGNGGAPGAVNGVAGSTAGSDGTAFALKGGNGASGGRGGIQGTTGGAAGGGGQNNGANTRAAAIGGDTGGYYAPGRGGGGGGGGGANGGAGGAGGGGGGIIFIAAPSIANFSVVKAAGGAGTNGTNGGVGGGGGAGGGGGGGIIIRVTRNGTGVSGGGVWSVGGGPAATGGTGTTGAGENASGGNAGQIIDLAG